MSNDLKRREFLKGSLAAGISASLPNVAFLSEVGEGSGAQKESDILTAHLIWSADSVPVQLEGAAVAIASSSNGYQPPSTPDLHSVFVREFKLETLPSTALIRLFSYTRYRLYINGLYQGRGPGRYQNQRPEYDTRDIRAALQPGRNIIAVLVHRDGPTGRIMRHDPGFAAVIELADGSRTQNIGTDRTWLSKPDLSFGPRKEAWSSIEEQVDSRKGVNFTDSKLSLSGWLPSRLVGGPDFFAIYPRTTPLQAETLVPWSSAQSQLPIVLDPERALSFDLPQIIQGYHLVELESDEGSEVEIAYLLPEGQTSGKNKYTARSGVQTYMGGDTFAFLRLSIRLRSGRAKLLRVEAIEVRYPFERVASFQSSDPFLNQLWTICARSLEVLSEDSYVDCADRERVEWTDDSPPAFDCTRVMMRGPDEDGVAYWGDNRLLKALLRRIALTQQPDGQIKAHSCSERFDIHAIMEDRSCDWVVLLREYFDSSGDLRLVRELWPTLARLMNWFLERRTTRGLVLAREWEVWDNPLRYQVCEGAGLNAMVYRALVDASYLGESIEKSIEGKAYAASAERLQSDFNSLLWNNDHGTYEGALFGPGSKTNEQLNGRMFEGPIVNGRYQPTVQGSLFALYSGIVPASRVPSVRNWIVSHRGEVKRLMSHYYLFHAMYQMEEVDKDREVLRLVRDGWKNLVNSPWQTTWEDLSDPAGSKVHLYGMVPGYFLTAFVLGARRIGPVSERTIRIEPRCGDLTRAEGTAVTEFGPVKIKWSKAIDGAFSIECTIPQKTRTTLRLYKLGQNEFVMVDHQRCKIQTDGKFIEVPLLSGSHVIQYPG